ncbi:MAG: hypothetical protein GXP50_13335 [Deltaproteobacteria bacterium]|nr:hypothetical protein [Deltaproteobacteria bacterium]
MNGTCFACGAVANGITAPLSDHAAEIEARGRLYFGLPRKAVLCPACTEDVVLVGRAMWEEERASLCPACRKESPVGEEWAAMPSTGSGYPVSRGARA